MVCRITVNKVFVACCISALLCAFLGLPGLHLTSRVHAAGSYPVQVSTDIFYGPQPDEVLDECLPVGAPPSEPGIIMIHGGGWVGGDKARYEQLCMRYAAQGYIATTINYRLAPQYQWPDQIGDVQLAVRYLRVNATNLGLDPMRMCALGDSAGAHLALMLDQLQTIHSADVASLYSDTSPAVQCAVDQFGPTALGQLYEENPRVQQVIYDLLDYQAPPSPLYPDASPLDNIAPQMGPALIIQGTQDRTVLPDQSQELNQALLNDSIPVQYISYVGGHEYSGLTNGQFAAIMAGINNFLDAVELPESIVR